MKESLRDLSYPSQQPYVGRFAPSPTGPLHFGSLLAATASYLDAKHHGGQWLLRIEDMDPPREMPGASDSIIHSLAAYQFEWDGAVIYQSHRHADYQDAINTLVANRSAFYCQCSRKQIAAAKLIGKEGFRYPGTCRSTTQAPQYAAQYAIRMNSAEAEIQFEDSLQGVINDRIDADYGDITLRRADGLYAYQLATAIDDGRDGITHIVRGFDLINSTSRQLFVRQSLALNDRQSYAHIPIACEANGQKLSKQNLSLPVKHKADDLWQALCWLEQNPPLELRSAEHATIWQWAIPNWDIQKLKAKQSKPAPEKFQRHSTL